jgi:uncharacterized protein (TIGR02444 family)
MNEEPSRFWSFSVAVYSDSGVQAECLDLQDRYGVDVNLLLLCAYVGAIGGAVLPQSDLREVAGLVADWHRRVVQSLRTARRALKPFAADPSPRGVLAAGLRSNVKAAELEAESIEQMMLEEWSARRIDRWPRAEPEAAVAANIRTLLATCDAPDLPQQLVAAVLAARNTRLADTCH